ncbi:MAG TPA: ribosome biogenesis GTP-binding protein YihA/YsxC [Bacteroidales bacterium]|jgi:GTP-binding protein|nr:ribosome biogenesis GTP-binding protein YihA/YsxC [Bacteroidales bacterium]HPS71458.1 ribosome biogenesis GTP-binding protein YihA/YsxC [Bacteroidales bacterium]
MQIKTITFLQSVVDWKKCPDSSLPEYAFIGRSNVGKSSLINMLANNNKLAKISGRPGKTQTINHFIVNNQWYLVDLPGYGYAKISKSIKENWGKMISDYITMRENLQILFVLIDSRLEPQKIDLEFINRLGDKMVPFGIIFTKTDKLTVTGANKNIEKFKKELSESWDELPPIFSSSAVSGSGKEELLNFIEEVNKQYFSNRSL